MERGIVKRKFVKKVIWLLKVVEWADKTIDERKRKENAKNACLGSKHCIGEIDGKNSDFSFFQAQIKLGTSITIRSFFFKCYA